ncbi:VOC family protein [Alkalihalobacterium elongatum]|uniref:VOC family protein n=1 Tax=Alkalihalobacterium elongatum TaxID=2675466 RepID=UPI001C1F1FBF|nr:VOC family protein [Alkalihalobacterium elongatum]
MELALDHIVHLSDPEKAMKFMRELGLYAVRGGDHENWGTCNSLCYFDLTYIEWIGIKDIRKAEKVKEIGIINQAFRERNKGDHLLSFAMRTSDIKKLSSELTNKGLLVRGPYRGERVLNDGNKISWKMLFIEDDSENLSLPFFIEWEQSDDRRRNDLINRNLMAQHKLGSELKCSFIGFAVNNLETTIERWKSIFNLESSDLIFSKTLNAKCKKLSLKGGDLLFCEPIGKGNVSEILYEYGERLFLFSCHESTEYEREIQFGNGFYWF